MNQSEILAESKKAIDLWLDKTYNESEFYSHIMTIIKEQTAPSEKHKEQLERYINKAEQMRAAQRYFFIHKAKLGDAKTLEQEFDQMTLSMLSRGYSIERFKKEKLTQTSLL